MHFHAIPYRTRLFSRAATGRMTLSAALAIGCAGLFFSAAAEASDESADHATGYVFDDANGNGQRDDGEQGVADVAVSNGREAVTTDGEGRYQLPVEEDTVIFVIKPRDWMTPTNENNLPRFYYLHKPDGSPEDFKYAGVEPTGPLPDSVDFPLVRREEPDRFRVVFFGDPQPRNQREVDYLAHDIIEELVGVDAAFGVSLGDIAFDDLNTFEPLNEAVAHIGLPWYNVHGNHDMNFDADGDEHAAETFQRIYGPATYAFNYGPVHFIMLDDVVYHGRGTEGRRYSAGLSDEQLQFIENDLAQVDEDRLIVLMMHIPLNQMDEADQLLELLDGRPHTFSLSAHTHTQEHKSLGETDHHHLIHGTTSGTWWKGALDETGIPHTMMRDGTPNGYSIATFDGTDYALEYKAARRPADYQMNIYAPEAVGAGETDEAEVWVNVFAGSEQSEVRMRLGEEGEWSDMKQVWAPDPYYRETRNREIADAEAAGRNTPRLNPPRESSHLWRANLPADLSPGSHLIHVRTTDMFDQTHEAHRIIRVTE